MIARPCLPHPGVALLVFSSVFGLTTPQNSRQPTHLSLETLPPSAFSTAPTRVRKALTNAGCRIVQSNPPGPKESHNLITGEFVRQGQKDWAALCADGASAYIYVVWSAPSHCAARLARADLSTYTTNEQAGPSFMRRLRSVSPSVIASFLRAAPHEVPVHITHDGIDDMLVGQGSRLHYCDGRNWRELPGAE